MKKVLKGCLVIFVLCMGLGVCAPFFLSLSDVFQSNEQKVSLPATQDRDLEYTVTELQEANAITG